MYCIIFFMYVLRHTHEECLAVPLASEHPLHFIKYTLTYCILFGALLFVVCIHVDIYTRGREALWHCLQGKCTRALCHSLEGKGEGRSDLSIQYMYTSIYCEYVLRGTQEECLAMLLTHAKASGLIALHRVCSNILYTLEHYCLLYVYVLIYTQGKGRHSGIVCKASAQVHSVILWKAKRKGTLIGQCIIHYDSCMYRIIFSART